MLRLCIYVTLPNDRHAIETDRITEGGEKTMKHKENLQEVLQEGLGVQSYVSRGYVDLGEQELPRYRRWK
jgi:hypothetical protein